MKERADVHLVRAGQAESREKAQAMIMAGEVFLGEKRINKASESVEEDAVLILRGNDLAYASRGGHKLEKALDVFKTEVAGRIAMDVGAAAGGFTDVLLRHGAAHVYAIDVGYGQFDWKLRNDPRVTLMERTNARLLTRDHFSAVPSLAVMDVSFISVRLILPALVGILGEQGRIVSLIKPQFEAGKGSVGKNGVVREAETHIRVLTEIRDFCPSLGWHVNDFTFSPIKGPKGNIEFLADLSSGREECVTGEEIGSLVRLAHETLRGA